jgi:hypothetical protein
VSQISPKFCQKTVASCGQKKEHGMQPTTGFVNAPKQEIQIEDPIQNIENGMVLK